jgi:HD superfamily phosphohydrolase
LGHWPFCHAIEDLRLVDFPRHEVLAERLLQHRELASLLRQDWGLEGEDVAHFLNPHPQAIPSGTQSILRSMLSGPIDVDKLDYLERDSLHAGVPYGRNFDRNRLVHSLCVDHDRHRLAITDKGRTAAEMMVFSRYVMFSEVYWHHAVRSATAMLQRAVYSLREEKDLVHAWLDMDDATMKESLVEHSRGKDWERCIQGLFGMRRSLYKRVAQFDRLVEPDLHRALARRPYPEIIAIGNRLCAAISASLGNAIHSHDVLIDAPPVKLEVQFDLRVRQRDQTMRELGEVSPVVQALATQQFDDLVKRVRIFVAPERREAIRRLDLPALLREIL